MLAYSIKHIDRHGLIFYTDKGRTYTLCVSGKERRIEVHKKGKPKYRVYPFFSILSHDSDYTLPGIFCFICLCHEGDEEKLGEGKQLCLAFPPG